MNSDLDQLEVHVVGTVRNAAGRLEQSLRDIERALYPIKVKSWLIIESDSSDKTLEVLQRVSSRYESFKFRSLGNLSQQMPERVQRIGFCREIARMEVCKAIKSKSARVIVADFDGPTRALSQSDLHRSILRFTDAAVVAANSSSRYYDILALRSKNWIEQDYRVLEHDLVTAGAGRFEAKYSALVSKQRYLNPKSSPVEVDSAFGGLAIYQASFFKQARYETTSFECEHVSLHRQIRSLGGRILIDPDLQVRPEARHIWASAPLFRFAWAFLLIVEKIAIAARRRLKSDGN